MRVRSYVRSSGRKQRISPNRKRVHELNGVPKEYHEDGAPELPVLPDEFNRFAPTVNAEDDAANRHTRLLRMLFFAAAGIFTVGALFFGKPIQPQAAEEPVSQAASPVPTQEAAVPTAVATPKPEETPTPAITAEPTKEPTPAPTATPELTPTPTAEPTPEPEIEGVELLYVEWTEGTGESAVFTIYARIPLKNIREKGLLATELEVFAWINGERTVDDWDGINTLEVSAADYGMEVAFGTDESGDILVTYTGTLYWADHPTPAWSDLVTIAVCGVTENTWELTDPSNSLTVGIGGKAFKYNTNET